MWCWVQSISCPLIGRMPSYVIRHFLFLGFPFVHLPVLVFLVFLEFASSSRYWYVKNLLQCHAYVLRHRLGPFGPWV